MTAAIEDAIVSRVCRLHYGLAMDIPFDENSDEHVSLSVERKKWDDVEQRFVMKGRMDWIVERVSTQSIERSL